MTEQGARDPGRAGGEGRRAFRVVTEEYADRIEVRVEEQEWIENFGWVSRGDPLASPFRRFCILLRRPGWLRRALWRLRPDGDAAEISFRARFQKRLQEALVAAQIEANRRNQERRLVTHHLESVREVLEPPEQ
jgi:hypothetical protein